MAIYTIQEVTVSTVTKGKNSYQVADVVYTTDRGENKDKKVLSFSNPAVFEIVSKIKGATRVEVSNGGAPYYNWTEIKVLGDEAPAANKAAPKSGSYVDTRETPEERARRQLMIVKQSSLANALTYWGSIKTINNPDYDYTVEEVLATADKFVDWVMSTGLEDTEDVG